MQRTEPATRAIDVRVEIGATPDAVWRALTEAAQLESWFPLNARVTPGAGGSIWVSWGGASTYESRITVWEPGRHLRLLDQEADPEKGVPVPIAQDYFIEGAGGRTVLRFVHSGFSHDAQWDDMFDTMSSGWRYFFINLKHYLEHHAGEHRAMVWTRRPVSGRSRAQLWGEVLGALSIDPDAREGAACTLILAGERSTGTIVQRKHPVHFAAALPGLNHAMLFLELEPGAETWHFGFWLSTYGLPQERVAALQTAVEGLMQTLLPGT